MKQIEVVAAIIHDGQDRVFATQRGYGEWKDYWEFPGGKMEPGESAETEFKVVFRSYTGAFIHFFVDKESGSTRMVEVVPALGIENEAGSIDLRDYLDL